MNDLYRLDAQHPESVTDEKDCFNLQKILEEVSPYRHKNYYGATHLCEGPNYIWCECWNDTWDLYRNGVLVDEDAEQGIGGEESDEEEAERLAERFAADHEDDEEEEDEDRHIWIDTQEVYRWVESFTPPEGMETDEKATYHALINFLQDEVYEDSNCLCCDASDIQSEIAAGHWPAMYEEADYSHLEGATPIFCQEQEEENDNN
jgi:hypothetical protein